ncbi:XRE family transcriptional regulator [Brevibacillus laterosporus]|nr:helix-turn-helix transcriptional regulator [Brevibacillus laterosporus]TPG68926.1 XRE family transcriptional regulator [Brevibacillus laterosporus]
MDTFGERLKWLRNIKSVSKHELAELLNVSERTITNYEANNREPNNETLVALADYFKITVDWLLGRSPLPFMHYSEDRLDKNNMTVEDIKKRYRLVLGNQDITDEQIESMIELIKAYRGLY